MGGFIELRLIIAETCEAKRGSHGPVMNGGTNTAAKEAGGGPGRAGFQPSGSHLGAGHVERVRRVRRRFVEGDEVLHEGHDGLVYLGIVVEVDCDERQCLVGNIFCLNAVPGS